MNWVLIRGLAREARHWGLLPELLKNIFQANVYCPDLKGAGSRYKELSPLSVDEMVEDLRRLWISHIQAVKKTSNDMRWSILAISLGGMVALKWSQMYPEDFKNVVIINSSSSDMGMAYQRMKLPTLVGLLRASFKKNLVDREKEILHWTTNHHAKTMLLLPAWVHYAEEYPISITNVLRQLVAAARFKLPTRHKFGAQIVFLASKTDRLCDYSCSVKMANVYKAPCFIHETAGHDLCSDDPEWVLSVVRTLLR